MSADDPENPAASAIRKNWESMGAPPAGETALFQPGELDIFVNKVTLETYIFHGKIINYEPIDHLEYNPADYSVDVVYKNGDRLDLGVKIQWLVRPHFAKADNVFIVRTQNGQSVDGTAVPLINLGRKG